MSITTAGTGDVTQYDTFRMVGTWEDSLNVDTITVEAQETRDIIEILLSLKVVGFTESSAEQSMFVEGLVSVSLGQENPEAESGQYLSGVRMPVHWQYNVGLRTNENNARESPGPGQELTRRFLSDPDIRFLWQQGETLFIYHEHLDEIGDQFAGYDLRGLVSYV